MITLKCKNCAGEMSIDLKGELACPYCGAKSHLSDIELNEYKAFRANMLNYLRAASDIAADEADGTFLWTYHEKAHYTAKSGAAINIDYLFYTEEAGIKTYVAKDSVVMVFDSLSTNKINSMMSGISMLEYPSAALKDLSKFFPTVKSAIDLDDGGKLIAIAKPENVYPLYAFGSIKPEHAAWIVSRLENMCCVFEFSEIVQGGINLDNLYINPKTHEAFLYGGWWNSRRKKGAYDNEDLLSLRKIADKIMGEYKESAPKLFKEFISSKPATDAYTDFEKWDEVIEKGFGGHKFVQFKKG